MSDFFRESKPFMRRIKESESRVQKKTFFIASEGEKTEHQYFTCLSDLVANCSNNLLVDLYPLRQNGKHLNHPIHIFEGLISDLNEEGSHLKEMYDKENDEIWIVCDRDKETFVKVQYSTLIKEGPNYGINIGITNPCFELVLLMHLEDIDHFCYNDLFLNKKISNKKNYLDVLLDEILGSYNSTHIKPKRFVKKEKILYMIEQSQKLETDLIELEDTLGTTVFILLEKLVEYLD